MRQAADDFPLAMARSFDAVAKRWVIWTGDDPDFTQKLTGPLVPEPRTDAARSESDDAR
jgi:hypothetical protein